MFNHEYLSAHYAENLVESIDNDVFQAIDSYINVSLGKVKLLRLQNEEV